MTGFEERWMRAALELAQEAAAEGEVPVGAVIVKEGVIVGRGRNRRERDKNALAHAELEAIRQACNRLGGWRLSGCDLYVTLEPCPMCAGAIINARIDRVIQGTADPKAGSCGSLVDLFALPYNHRPTLVTGVLEEECRRELQNFFRRLRFSRKNGRQRSDAPNEGAKKRVLILSANTGGGHNSAAKALQEELEGRSVDCSVEDGLRFVSPHFSSIVSHGHIYMYRHLPGAFGRAYSFQERHRSDWIAALLSRGVERLRDFVEENGFDAVVCVHVFSAMMVTAARRKYGLTLPFYFVSTDYTCCPGSGELDADAWFVPAAELSGEFEAAGIPAEKLKVTGIPVKKCFSAPPEKKAARQALGLDPAQPVLLLSCGSMGCGHINRELSFFGRQLPEGVQTVVACGNNRELLELLETAAIPCVQPISFTDKMADYMAAADVCVTKPGGLTTTELLAVGCPAVLLLAVPGCESKNMAYFQKRFGLPTAFDWETAVEKAVSLTEEPERLKVLAEGLVAARPEKRAAEAIVDYTLRHMK